MKIDFKLRISISCKKESVELSRDRTPQEGVGVESRLPNELKKVIRITKDCLLIYHYHEHLMNIIGWIASLVS